MSEPKIVKSSEAVIKRENNNTSKTSKIFRAINCDKEFFVDIYVIMLGFFYVQKWASCIGSETKGGIKKKL